MERRSALADGPIRLDRLMQLHEPGESRSRIAAHIAAGRVEVNGAKAAKAGQPMRAGDEAAWEPFGEPPAPNLEPADIPLDAWYEDDDIVVVGKPRGLPTHPAPGLSGPTLVHALLARGHQLSEGAGPWRPGIVHRLDRETTGLLIAAKNSRAHRHLAEQIAAKTAERRYAAAVVRRPEHEAFTVDLPLGKDPRRPMRRAVIDSGKPARTHFKILGPSARGWTLAARLETGRTHQIRVHLAAMRLWVAGDDIYAPAEHAAGPLQLHAAYLKFRRPSDNEEVEVFAPPPDDFDGSVHCSLEAFSVWNPRPNRP